MIIVDKIQRFYRHLNPAGRLGLWGLPVLIVVVSALYFTLPNSGGIGKTSIPDLVTLTAEPTSHIVKLGAGNQPAVSTSAHYRPAATEILDRVLQQLGEFRAAYKQIGPTFAVVHPPGNKEQYQIAKTLSGLLARYNLNAPGNIPENETSIQQPLILYCSPSDLTMAYAFLSAIAPYIRGNAAIVMDSDYSVGHLKLYLQGSPQFTEQGVAVF